MPSCTNKPGAGAADLALVEPDRVDQPLDGRVNIGIIEDDVGGFAAQFQGQGLARARPSLSRIARPTGGRAGEGDLVDAGVVHEVPARVGRRR